MLIFARLLEENLIHIKCYIIGELKTVSKTDFVGKIIFIVKILMLKAGHGDAHL